MNRKINRNINIALIRRSSKEGFALPITLGLGLIMILIAATLIVRAQGDQTTASAQKATAQSLAIAEGGLSRTLAKLNQSNPDISPLLKRTYDPNGLTGAAVNEWTTTTPTGQIEWTTSSNQPCAIAPNALLSGTIGNSTYTVLAYRYDPSTKKGTLVVKGSVPVGVTSSESRVQQVVNVSPKSASFIAVLGTNDIALGNNDVLGINGNVACTTPANCPITTCPPTHATSITAIGGGGSANVDGKIFIGSITTPTLPAMPSTWSGSGTAPTTAFTITDSGSAFNYTSNNTTLVFPRPSDIATHVAGTPYHYSINNINANGFNITINTQRNAATNPTGDPVYFWVSGTISMGGSSQLNHTASADNPTAFRIYGTSTTSQDILVASGASNVDAFIFAPNARVGINGTGTIDGIVYAKSFGEIGANGNAVINVPNSANLASSLGDLAVYFSNQTDSISSWQRQEVP